MKRFIFLGLVLILALGVLSSCSSDDKDDSEKSEKTTTTTEAARSDEVKGTEVLASLKEFKIVLDPTTGPAGDTTFEITNDGTIDHEFVVVQTDLDNRELPVDKDGQVDEEGKGFTPVDELEDISKGSTRNLALDLKAGNYVVFCNIAGHYAGGMSASFTVK